MRGEKSGPGKGERKTKIKRWDEKNEYIKYLEMENDILKSIAELENSQLEKNRK
jgi:hypothetical protein